MICLADAESATGLFCAHRPNSVWCQLLVDLFSLCHANIESVCGPCQLLVDFSSRGVADIESATGPFRARCPSSVWCRLLVDLSLLRDDGIETATLVCVNSSL